MMVRSRRKGRRKVKGRPKDWHHRVPDFKLVYCGPPKPRKETQHAHRKRLAVSVLAEENSVATKKSEKRKQMVTS